MDFVEILKNKVLKIFSEILAIFWLVYQEAKYRVVWRYLWSNSVTNCDIQIWHTLAEVKIFVFLFVIKLFLNCCCSIDVLYCFANFFILRSVLCV